MAVLGKRKAPEPTISTEDAQEIFRRHFEAQFLPLPEAERKAREKEEDDDNDSEDDSDGSEGEGGEWGGLSNDDDEGSDEEEDDDDELDEDDEDDSPTIEVVDHSVSQAPKTSTMSKRELKAFMSSRPPDPTSTSSSKTTPQPSSKSSSSLPEDAPSLLAQDLELRRLIAESHLLQTNKPTSLSSILSSSSAQSEPKTFAAGRVRQKALDLRIQALGSKTSILKQEKMPMHMRKGINAAAVERETKRRREAKESGVILERETGKKKKRERRTGGGGGGFGPAVGRMRGAELRISERDVKKIEGARDTFGRRGKR
ncbi:hypothetical protein V8C26DRAFT_395247 [Trichoderma gracile]